MPIKRLTSVEKRVWLLVQRQLGALLYADSTAAQFDFFTGICSDVHFEDDVHYN